MANRERGEVSLEIDGTTYTMVLDLEALCHLEDHFSTPAKDAVFPELLERASRGSARHIRGIVWAALQRHHKGMTLEETSDLIQASGGLAGFGEKLNALAGSTQPDAEDASELSGGKKTRPRKAQNDAGVNGVNSTSKLVASA